LLGVYLLGLRFNIPQKGKFKNSFKLCIIGWNGGKMDINIKGKELIIRHTLKRGEMYKVSNGKDFKTISIYKSPQICVGYSSKTEDGKNIILADYDHTDKNIVLEEISGLQRKYSLSPFYLFTTKEKMENGVLVGNYHVVCLNKFSSRKVFEILGDLSIDDNFRDSPLRKLSKSWVLRISNKKGSGKVKFIKLIGEGNLSNEISTAHLKLFCKYFPEINHPDYTNQDNLKEIKLQAYETKS
jgi:hypothetical protein